MIIYKITNTLNNKIYIGQTKLKLVKRWNGHVSDSKRCNYRLANAIAKYGEENFKKEIIVEGDFNKALTDELETHYIRLYNSKHRDIGYNIKDGGNSVEMSDETKQKISLKNKGRKISDSEQKIRRQKNVDRYSLEKALEISKKHSNNFSGGNNPRALKVIHIETKEIFNCLKDASIKYSMSKETLSWQLRKNKCKLFKYYTE